MVGPAVSGIGQGEPETGPVRDLHPAVTDRQPFVESRLDPLEVLDSALGRICSGEVQVDLHDEMRGKSDTRGLGLGHHVEEGG